MFLKEKEKLQGRDSERKFERHFETKHERHFAKCLLTGICSLFALRFAEPPIVSKVNANFGIVAAAQKTES